MTYFEIFIGKPCLLPDKREQFDYKTNFSIIKKVTSL